MAAVALAARLLLAAVLVVTGASKVVSGAELLGSREFAIGVAATEIGVGAVLVARPYSALAGIAAIALLVAFSGYVLRVLLRGERAPCACFGSLSRAPISSRTLVRNGALLALAVLATGTHPR